MGLYPLKFKSIYHKKIWGGNKLQKDFNKPNAPEKCGESWEISGIQNNLSIVENGYLSGNNLQELIEVYMGDLLGDKVYEKFGDEFPLLIKLIDAKDDLSIQVHPNDEFAMKCHNAQGKTEMWYVLDADENSRLISGFRKTSNKIDFAKALESGELNDILNYEPVKFGDAFYIPSGRIHNIGKGIVLAEIQQTSDITYRVFDFNRKGLDGKTRELHADLASDVIDYKAQENYRTNYEKLPDRSNTIIKCKYFTSNIIPLINILERNYIQIDSFVVLMCILGSVDINANGENTSLKKGETILIPAEIDEIRITPIGYSELLEIYIP